MIDIVDGGKLIQKSTRIVSMEPQKLAHLHPPQLQRRRVHLQRLHRVLQLQLQLQQQHLCTLGLRRSLTIGLSTEISLIA